VKKEPAVKKAPATVTAAAPVGAGNGSAASAAPKPIPKMATKATQQTPTATGSEPIVRKIDHATAEPVDLLDAAGVPVAKRAIPIVAGVLLILWFLRRRRRR
jgi:hypothetical protein